MKNANHYTSRHSEEEKPDETLTRFYGLMKHKMQNCWLYKLLPYTVCISDQ